MRTSVNLPDETIATVRDRAADEGITVAEWMRRAILEAVTPRHPDEHPAGTPGTTPTDTPTPRTTPREIDALTARIASLEEDIERARAEAVTARHDAVTATADRLALVERAARADGLATARLEELERVRADLEHERDGRRRDLIETAAGYVRAALTTSTASTTADEGPARRTVRERVRSWLNR